MTMVFKFSLFPVIFFSLALAQGCDDDPTKAVVFRLPTTTRPESYELRFILDLDGNNFAFSGQARITILATSTVHVITLNAKELNVSEAFVTDIGLERNLPVRQLVHCKCNEQLEIHLDESVIANRTYAVTLLYKGKLRTDETGFNTRSYQKGNETKWFALLDLEPVYARRAFPCYDEPAYKAIFNISVMKSINQIALSNMPIRNVEVIQDNVAEVVYFENTPRMSTYLVALFVGEFVPSKDRGSHVTVYTQPQFADRREHVHTEAAKFLRAMSEYTGIEYMLPKLDLLFVPCQVCQAMECWGLNVHQERYAMSDGTNKVTLTMIDLLVLRHELAHQWFGNLVTGAWWDSLWLKEGFATYFQYFASETLKTGWPMEELFVVEIHQNVLIFDRTFNHPVTSPVNSPEDILKQYDLIAYRKSASLLRVLRYLVTEKLFQLSIRHYLRVTRELSVAEPNDLFASFDKVLYDNNYNIGNGLTVHEFMSNWTLQSGFPMLQIKKNKTSNTLSVTQRRCIIHPGFTENTSPAWHIGLTFTTELDKDFNSTQPRFWSNKTSKTTVIPVPKNSGWYIFNIQSIGYYRVNYDTGNWVALIKQLHEAPEEIHLLNRVQLIEDAFHLAVVGELDYSVPLYLVKYLHNENSAVPWYSALRWFTIIKHIGLRKFENLQVHYDKLIESMNKKLKESLFNGSDESNLILIWMCKVDERFCTTTPLQ